MNPVEQLLYEALMLPSGNFVSLLPERPRWWSDALCKEYPEVNFFPRRGENSTAAKAVCNRCLVRDECLQAALEDETEHGVWGGMSAQERRRLRKRKLIHSSGCVEAA